jgi:hypothetical protein
VRATGFPLGYEVPAGNTSDKTTLRRMLRKIEAQYGKANRIWVMDRGIPTEEVLAEMRAADPSAGMACGQIPSNKQASSPLVHRRAFTNMNPVAIHAQSPEVQCPNCTSFRRYRS